MNNCDREKRVTEAMVAIKERGLKFSHAAEIYGVPKSTLHDHVSRNCSKFTKGRLCVFTEEEEKQFVNIFKELMNKGYRLSPLHCRRAAFMYAELSQNKHNFNKAERMAGRKWFDGFAKRNHIMVVRRQSNSSKKLAVCNRNKTSKNEDRRHKKVIL
jgi:predicted XRE-type DNA-binding protein